MTDDEADSQTVDAGDQNAISESVEQADTNDSADEDTPTPAADQNVTQGPPEGPEQSVAASLPDGVMPSDGGDEDGVEPVELLVQLAEDGEIDPWDIDIVTVTEAFLAALDEGDLKQSGRALFYASVLLRMKSDTLLGEAKSVEEEPDPDPWEEPFSGPMDAPPEDPIADLEDEMDRRLDRKRARGSPETLDELVRELREAERGSWWKSSREYDTSDGPADYRRGTMTLDYHGSDDARVDGEPTAEDVTHGTHGEDIEEIIDQVQTAIQEQFDAGRNELLFAEIEDAGGSRVMTYLAVLFLANRSELRLKQDELFGDLWIQDPAGSIEATGAVAG